MKIKKITLIIIAFFMSVTMFSQNVVGDWSGTSEIMGMKLKLVFHIEEDGTYLKSTMDSPDQGAKGIPVTKISFESPTLMLEIANIGFKYTGVLKGDTLIEGAFTQMGKSFPLNLKKGIDETKRPQEPKKPYPYIEEDVKFINEEAGIALAGTFTYPDNKQKYPAVILITGSGAQNRDEELLGHKPFLVLSDYLTRRGIAVLRFDDRGTAQSEGDFSKATSVDFASDVLAGLSYLKNRKEVNPEKIGLVGHSEGGMIAFMLAAKHKDVAFLVSMAGPGVKGDSILALQRRSLIVDKEKAYDNDLLAKKMITLVKEYSTDFLKANIDSLINDILPQKQGWADSDDMKRNAANSFARMSSPWFRFFIEYDPMDDLRKVKCPVLAINGGKDLQVDANINISSIEKGLSNAGNKNYLTKVYSNLNHLFQNCNTGHISEYATIEETISPEVLSDIADWISTVAK